MGCLQSGMTLRRTAHALSLSGSTVDRRVRRMKDKFKVHTIHALINAPS